MPAKTTPKDWDAVRTAFATSIMVDTSLSSLAQNLDGPDWPIKGADETPAKYIDLSHEEVVELLALKNQPEERLDDLTSILRDTLAFDDPFGEMLEQTEVAASRDNPVLKNLAKLGIPEGFPIEFCLLSPDTREFCRLEKLGTLAEFAIFAQNMSQNVIVGGDFRTLLNALSHVDERAIARYLPFRPGARGLHIIEAAAQLVRSLPPEQRMVLTQPKASVPPAARTRMEEISMVLTESRDALKAQLASGSDLRRLVQVINDPDIEPAVVLLLTPFIPRPTLAEEPVDAPKKGLFGSLSRWFKK
jgi:hypothetical protein